MAKTNPVTPPGGPTQDAPHVIPSAPPRDSFPTISPFITNGNTIQHRAPDTSWSPGPVLHALPVTMTGLPIPGSGPTSGLIPVDSRGIGLQHSGSHILPSWPQLPPIPRLPIATPPHVVGGPVPQQLSLNQRPIPIGAVPTDEIAAYFSQAAQSQSFNLDAVETQALARIPANMTNVRARVQAAFARLTQFMSH